jgi:hypothetical protein
MDHPPPGPRPYKRTPNPSPPHATPLPTLSFLSPTLRCRPGERQVTAVHLFTAPPPRRLSIIGKEQIGTSASSSSFSPPRNKPLVVVALARRSLVTLAASPIRVSLVDQLQLLVHGCEPCPPHSPFENNSKLDNSS